MRSRGHRQGGSSFLRASSPRPQAPGSGPRSRRSTCVETFRRPARVVVRTARLNTILGTELGDDQIVGYLAPIGFTAVALRPGELDVTVPTFRPDVLREIDVIEEVARHHGYENLPRRLRSAPQVGGISDRQRVRRRLRNAFAHTGAHESWTSSLIAPGDHERIGLDPSGIVLANPINPEDSVLRRSLMPGLLRAVAFNMNRRQNALRLFEVGNVFPVPDRRAHRICDGSQGSGDNRRRRAGDGGTGSRRPG